MNCYYINESMLQDNTFSRAILQRFLSYYRRHQGELLLISAVKEINLDYLPQDIRYLVSPCVFDVDSLKGELSAYYVQLEEQRLDPVYSGCCIRYDSVSKYAERIYFDLVNDPVADLANRVMDEMQSILEEQGINKHFYN